MVAAGSCPLCNPEGKTEWLSDELWEQVPPELRKFNVFCCETDGQWMIVAKHHGDWLPGEREEVEQLRDILFPRQPILRWEMRKLPEHAHAHIDRFFDTPQP